MHLIKPGKAMIPKTFKRVLKMMTKYHSIEVIALGQGFPI